jgi:hypothetical protein
VALLVAIIAAATSAWFFLNQTYTPNQTNEVRITAFSVDPEGWKSGGGLGYSCPFDITLQNTGTNDAQRLWLKATMYRLGEAVGNAKQGYPLMVNLEFHGFNLSAGEVRNLQGVMYWLPADVNTGEGHPFGATYMAQVVFENSTHALDTATVVEPFSIFVVAITLVTVIAIAILIYFKKRKRY